MILQTPQFSVDPKLFDTKSFTFLITAIPNEGVVTFMPCIKVNSYFEQRTMISIFLDLLFSMNISQFSAN